MESKGRLILILIAGIVVAFGAIAIYSNMSSDPSATAPDAKAGVTRVMVAKRDLSVGTLVQVPQDIDWDTVPPETITPDTLVETGNKIENFHGAVVRRQLHAGDMIPKDALMRAGEGGFMPAVLEAGMRAVSIGVNVTSGNGGFISPGDRVDLIVTHHVKQNNGQSDSVISETFVRDVRIVAVDQQLDNPENKAILAKTVTVEVSPQQAEQIAVASEMGKISVVLRGLLSNASPDTRPANLSTDLHGNSTDTQGNVARDPNVTRDSDISQALGHENISPHIRVIRGDQTENVQLY